MYFITLSFVHSVLRAELMDTTRLIGDAVMQFPNENEAALLNISDGSAAITLPHALLLERANQTGSKSLHATPPVSRIMIPVRAYEYNQRCNLQYL